MNIPGWGIFLIVVAIIGILLFFLYRFGDKQQKKQEEARQQMYDNMQVVTMLVIDKKRMKISEAGFPKAVLAQMPKRASRSKAPVVKAKIGPQIVSLLCDESVYDQVPVKAEIKAQISGIYIVGIKNTRNVAPPEPEKKNFIQKWAIKNSTMTSDEAPTGGDLKSGKNAKALQQTSKGQMKNKALNPSAKKNKSTKKKKHKKKKH
jgi:hypothetical protein